MLCIYIFSKRHKIEYPFHSIGWNKNIVIISLQSLRPLREELLSRSNYSQGLESVAENSNNLNLFTLK